MGAVYDQMENGTVGSSQCLNSPRSTSLLSRRSICIQSTKPSRPALVISVSITIQVAMALMRAEQGCVQLLRYGTGSDCPAGQPHHPVNPADILPAESAGHTIGQGCL